MFKCVCALGLLSFLSCPWGVFVSEDKTNFVKMSWEEEGFISLFWNSYGKLLQVAEKLSGPGVTAFFSNFLF